MKTTITILVAFLISISSFAQPESINYKALIKDGNGNLVAGQTINVKFTILKNNGTSIAYQETHTNKTTDANGILIVNIGEGTPIVSSMINVDWGSGIHALETGIDIEQDGSFVNIDQTVFNAVPYALNAANVSGLETLDEGNGIGWRLVGSSSLVYGPIGNNAIDLSIGGGPTNDFGATGGYSIAMGFAVRASGDESISMGSKTKAEAYRSIAIGSNNIGGGTRDSWSPEDSLFEIGNSLSSASPSNALTILKNGTITAPSFDISEITDAKALITKEFADTNYNSIPFSGDYNDLSNQPTIILPTGLERVIDINSGWRLTSENAFFHANIGFRAVDLSIVDGLTTEIGARGYISFASGSSTKAIGSYATAMGKLTTALGINSTAIGNKTTAIGINSTAMGLETIAVANASTALGKYNVAELNGLFMVGNGSSAAAADRKNAFIVKEDGKTGVNTSNPASLFEVAHGSSAPTPSNRTNAFSIRNISSPHSWQFAVATSGGLGLYKNGAYRGGFNEINGIYYDVSDRRLKKDITPLDNGTLNKVMLLNPVSYLMKDQTDTNRNLGLISQEVQELFPSITHYVEESDILTLSYTELIPILIKALQEQQGIIEAQNSKLTNQDLKINNLTAEMDQFKTLDQRVKQLENALKTIE
ncbi:tail fiber domain-containing protein [Mariniflexile sp.]|uniref:tail fiber domain-containing protein n=1 Tax=Mariniflexile sp. TaxID=1979402 RepID=UPI004047139C